MKLSIDKLSSKLTLGQRLRLQRSAKVNGLIVGLEIPTNNFRTKVNENSYNEKSYNLTKIATGKIFTPLCFFCKGTPNHVCIDLKKVTFKFDLRSKQIWP